MTAQNPILSPDFIHVIRVEEQPPPLKLVTFPDGFRCFTHTSIQETEFIYNEVFIKQEYLRHGLSLEGASCIFDVGANIGMFALFAKLRNPKAFVCAVEPIPDTFEVLRRNVELHRLERVRLLNCAVGSRAEPRRTFAFYPNMAGNSTSAPELKKAQVDFIHSQLGPDLASYLFRSEERFAPVRTLSEILREEKIRTVDFLKIDVEGDELAVLQGIARRDYRRIREMAFETHSAGLADEVSGILKNAGYRVFRDTGSASFPGVAGLYAIRG
ncbi:MAG: FkbM family methyltransferase [Anaerolineales bacterium]|nr:FkbM family methyltransferase [Anaerolineales bacterium]